MDYYITVRVQQGRLMKAMEAAGIKTQKKLGEEIGKSPSIISALMNFRESPLLKSGSWKPVVLDICAALDVFPEDIFPEHLRHVFPNNVKGQYLCSLGLNILDSKTPFDLAEESNRAGILRGILSESLTERESEAVKMIFFEDKTLSEVSEHLGVSKERAMQIEAKCLRKLRHPKVLCKLEKIMYDD